MSESVQEKAEPQSPRKVDIACSFLRLVPQPSFLKTSEDIPSKEAKSPIPLPDGVFRMYFSSVLYFYVHLTFLIN